MRPTETVASEMEVYRLRPGESVLDCGQVTSIVETPIRSMTEVDAVLQRVLPIVPIDLARYLRDWKQGSGVLGSPMGGSCVRRPTEEN